MQTWETFFENREITIQDLAKYFQQHFQAHWKSVLQEHRDELLDTFEKIGEPAYGLYMSKLLTPLYNELTQAGLIWKPGFILPQSMEHWGPPEERERCMWCVVIKGDGTPIGTLVLRIFHSHAKFDIPAAPDIFALEETEQEAIIASISQASIRLNKTFGGFLHQDRNSAEMQKWEYSAETGLGDYLNSGQDQFEVSALDVALSKWGKHGWELASVVPYQGRLIAFFKRPASR